jgi:hypothetical protein
MLTSQLAGVPTGILGEKVVNLEEKRSEILGALDFMISGF